MKEIKPLVLTDAQIDEADPAKAAWKKLLDHLDHLPYEKWAAHIRQLPQHWRAAYTTFWLQCEVDNGGFHQFFWNSDGDLNSETLEDLGLIGADPIVAIFQKALAVYRKHDYAEEKRRAGFSWHAFTRAYRQKRMRALDDAFYEVARSIFEYLNEFIRANKRLYLCTEQGT